MSEVIKRFDELIEKTEYFCNEFNQACKISDSVKDMLTPEPRSVAQITFKLGGIIEEHLNKERDIRREFQEFIEELKSAYLFP